MLQVKFAKSSKPSEVEAEIEKFLADNNLSKTDVVDTAIYTSPTEMVVMIIWDDGDPV